MTTPQELTDERLLALCARRAYVHIDRDEIAGDSGINGYLLAGSGTWLLLAEVTDFHLNGYTLVRRADVSHLRAGPLEQYFAGLLAKEGVTTEQLAPPLVTDLSETGAVFEALAARGGSIIAEDETGLEDGTDLFVIGRIVRVGKKSTSLLHFDAMGEWDEMPTLIDYRCLTRITFGSEYLRVFDKYTSPFPGGA